LHKLSQDSSPCRVTAHTEPRHQLQPHAAFRLPHVPRLTPLPSPTAYSSLVHHEASMHTAVAGRCATGTLPVRMARTSRGSKCQAWRHLQAHTDPGVREARGPQSLSRPTWGRRAPPPLPDNARTPRTLCHHQPAAVPSGQLGLVGQREGVRRYSVGRCGRHWKQTKCEASCTIRGPSSRTLYRTDRLSIGPHGA
jgi:hypothetical protein